MTRTHILSTAALLLLAVSETATAQTWTQLLPAPYPTLLARRTGGCTYDPIQGKLLIYGGLQSGPTLTLNDTWTFDGATWTQLAPATTPPPRWGHKMVYDSARGRIVTFGGRSPTTTANANDTWEWDGSNWAQVVTSNAPSVRAFYALSFDDRRGKTVLFGGGLGGLVTGGGNETWEYDGTNWTQVVTPFVMPGLESPAMVYDKGRGVTVLFGGWNGSAAIDYRTTWEYDGVDWVVRPTGNAPLTGYRTGCVYDDLRGRVVLYGGYAGGVIQNKVWEYDGNDWTNVLAGVGPGKITEGYMGYSPAIGQTMYFGGSGPPVTGTVNNETWLYVGVTTAIAAKFGQGCATSAGVPVLTPTTTPVLGSNYVLDTTNGAFAGIGIAAHGFSNTNWALGSLPANLSAFGFSGCRLEVSTDASLLLVFTAGTATNTLAFPNDPGLAGIPLFSQVLVLDATAPNGNGGMSNAVHAVLGS
jgi:hypothetical protein